MEDGGRALYVLDPGGHLVELLTRPYEAKQNRRSVDSTSAEETFSPTPAAGTCQEKSWHKSNE